MSWSFLPNLITLVRLFLLVPLTYYLISKNYSVALLLFFVAGFSDALDGFLAKQFSWTSRFGAILDPLADKALLIVTMVVLAMNGAMSWLLLSVVIFRDIYIVAGAYYYHYRLGPYDMEPSYLSKLNTFCQLLFVCSVLLSLGYIPLANGYLLFVEVAAYITTISSGVHYGWVWGAKFKAALNQEKELTEDVTRG